MNLNVAILEFRPGPGGEEAKIWADDLRRMYTRFANSKGWKVTQLSNDTIRIVGDNVYQLFQTEAGTHRVQRVPVTEKSGRIHTSTATVAVLPEIPETEINLNPADLEWSFFRSSGAGGQNVNKVSSAVRVKHRPSGIVVECQTERDQYQNRMYALSILRGRLWELAEEKRLAQLGAARSAIGRGLRSEKIRTYNFLQDRVTDHRIGKSWGRIDDILDGKLEKILAKLHPESLS